ncbi:MAG: phage minor head protein [Candidatus Methylumidiphilus sp.]
MADPHAEFEKEALKQAGSLNRIRKDTVSEVTRLLLQAQKDIQAKIKAQPTDYNLWYGPQLNKAIEQQLNEWQEDAAIAASNGQTTAFDAGQSLISEPVAKLGVDLTALAPQLDTGQLKAMQAFTVSKMKGVAMDAINRVQTELALTIIGSQNPTDTIRRVQEIMGGIAKTRAVAIVRTELGRAYGVAAQARAEQAVEHVPGLQKQWRRSGKIHSRRSHDLTDGQIRPVDQPFIIGTGHVTPGKEPPGPRLMHPHDPKGPVSEVVNCGCIALPYLEEWKDQGLLQTPGKKAFSEQEIALNPFKADLHYLDETPTVGQILDAQDAAKAAINVKAKARRVLLQAEKALIPDINERSIAISPTGEILVDKEGAPERVTFTPGELLKLKDAWVTHTHTGISSFSPGDIGTASTHEFAEIRAIDTVFK